MAKRRRYQGESRVRKFPGSGSTTRRVVPFLSSVLTRSWEIPHKRYYWGNLYSTPIRWGGSFATPRPLSLKKIEYLQNIQSTYRAALHDRTLKLGQWPSHTKPQSLVCGRRQIRKEVLFANRIAGRNQRNSPGRGGTYKRTEESKTSCT